MNSTYSITSKFQVTIPKEIREQVGLSDTDKVSFERRGTEIVIKRIPTLEEVALEMQANLKQRGWNKTVTNQDMKNARDIFYKKGGKW